jgi:hypothetical protein
LTSLFFQNFTRIILQYLGEVSLVTLDRLDECLHNLTRRISRQRIAGFISV